MKTLFKLSAVVFLCLINSAMATSFSEPVDYDVNSANGKFILHVSAKDGNHEVTGEFHSNEAWKFSHRVAFQSFYVSDDGETVAAVDWAVCKADELDQPAVVIHGRKGVRQTFSYRDLSIPRKYSKGETGPIGDFWRIWRGDASLVGNLLRISGEGRKPSYIDLQTAKLLTLHEGASATNTTTTGEVSDRNVLVGEDSDDTLRFYLSKSELVVTGTILSDPAGVVDKKGFVTYLCQFKIDDVQKGDTALKGTVIWVGIARYEMGEQDKHPLIKMGGECLLFLKSSKPDSPTWVTADSWFGIQHLSPSLSRSLRRVVGEAADNPDAAK